MRWICHRAQTFIRAEVEGFVPAPADLADYPRQLQALADKTAAAGNVGGGGSGGGGSSTSNGGGGGSSDTEIMAAMAAAPPDAAEAAAAEKRALATSVPAAPAAAAAAAASVPKQEQEELVGWYPPVRSTLLLLPLLYRCVDSRTFAGLAQEALSGATAAVQVRWCDIAHTCMHFYAQPSLALLAAVGA